MDAVETLGDDMSLNEIVDPNNDVHIDDGIINEGAEDHHHLHTRAGVDDAGNDQINDEPAPEDDINPIVGDAIPNDTINRVSWADVNVDNIIEDGPRIRRQVPNIGQDMDNYLMA